MRKRKVQSLLRHCSQCSKCTIQICWRLAKAHKIHNNLSSKMKTKTKEVVLLTRAIRSSHSSQCKVWGSKRAASKAAQGKWCDLSICKVIVQATSLPQLWVGVKIQLIVVVLHLRCKIKVRLLHPRCKIRVRHQSPSQVRVRIEGAMTLSETATNLDLVALHQITADST